MKTKFQQYKSLALISLLSFGAASLLTASAAEAGGKDILHLNLTKSFTNDGETPDATGSVRLKYHQQGNSTVQSLELNVSSLDITVPHHLLCVWDVDSEDEPVLKPVAEIEPDADGVAKIRYMSVKTPNGKEHSLGRGKTPLPDGLNPLSLVRQLVIATTNGGSTQVLASATLDNPEHLTYLVKRDISMNDIPASLRIQANDQRGQLRLSAGNLEKLTEYVLLLNGGAEQSGGFEEVVTTDAKGKLAIRYTDDPLAVLGLESVEIWDPIGQTNMLEVLLP